MKLLAYGIIPAYTLLFTNGYSWVTTNFSVIGNLIDNQLAFLIWGILVGIYFHLFFQKIRDHIILSPICSRLIPTALVLLLCAITTPYLPEELPLKSVLHIAFAFLAAVLLILFLLLVSWAQYQHFPDRYRSFLMGILMIIAGSAVLFISVGIISTVLEIYVTFTTVFMADRLLEAAASERAYLLQME